MFGVNANSRVLRRETHPSNSYLDSAKRPALPDGGGSSSDILPQVISTVRVSSCRSLEQSREQTSVHFGGTKSEIEVLPCLREGVSSGSFTQPRGCFERSRRSLRRLVPVTNFTLPPKFHDCQCPSLYLEGKLRRTRDYNLKLGSARDIVNPTEYARGAYLKQ